MKTKRLFLNISLIAVLCLTLVFGVILFLSWDQYARERATNIATILALALVTPVLIACFLGVFLVEISVYFNLRYFLLCEEKTTRRTVCNILMLVASGVAVVFGTIGALTDSAITHAAISLCTGGFVSMMILRVADFILIKHGERARDS